MQVRFLGQPNQAAPSQASRRQPRKNQGRAAAAKTNEYEQDPGTRTVVQGRHAGGVDIMKSLSQQELLMLLAAARAHRERDWLLILVCFWHGLRASELVSFQRDAIVDGYLVLLRPDGSDRLRHMLVEHPEPLLNEKDALIEFAARSDWGVPVFDVCRRRVDQLMKRYCAEVGIPAELAHAHTLRHTVARLSIESAGVEHARRWLGHKSMGSIYEYLKVPQESSGREAMAAKV